MSLSKILDELAKVESSMFALLRQLYFALLRQLHECGWQKLMSFVWLMKVVRRCEKYIFFIYSILG
jgi:hypothetical protein